MLKADKLLYNLQFIYQFFVLKYGQVAKMVRYAKETFKRELEFNTDRQTDTEATHREKKPVKRKQITESSHILKTEQKAFKKTIYR